MKTIRYMLRGIFKSFLHNDVSKQDALKQKEPVFMTLEEAKRDPTLVSEIYNQLNNAKLTIGSSNNYIAGIKYKSHQYYIQGTHKEWESFFSCGYMESVGTQMNNRINVLDKQ